MRIWTLLLKGDGLLLVSNSINPSQVVKKYEEYELRAKSLVIEEKSSIDFQIGVALISSMVGILYNL